MKKRILGILLCCVMLLNLIPAAVFAEGSAAPVDITGSGASDDPYLIYTASGLKAFCDKVNGQNGQTQNIYAHAKLMNDIVLNDGTFDAKGNYTPGESGADAEQWTPIVGYYGYRGTFDGGGYTIRGLYVKDAGLAGLFGKVYQGTVKNVTVTGYVEGTQYVGGIVGHIDNASITGCTNAATVKGIGTCNVGGIVGYFYCNGNVRSCANLGSVRAQISSDQGTANVGGIAGGLGDNHITIADCYNAGSIAIEDSGAGGGDYVPYLGGIVGATLMTMEPSYISNCYSVGPLTYRGSASAVIHGIAGDVLRYYITNCYWLEDTAESGVGGYPMSSSYAAAKSKTEFADGTVLELLKNNRTDSPWAKCGYLGTAGMTVPLLDWQTADSHDHNFEWKHTDTEHWKECGCGVTDKDSKAAHSGTDDGDCTTAVVCACGVTITAAKGEHNWGNLAQDSGNDTHTRKCLTEGCSASEAKPCSGGIATCTEQASCEICGKKYGKLKAHSYSTEWSTDEINHWHKCTECEAKSDEAKHADTDKDHKCDVCGKVLSICADTNRDHKCDLCGKALSEHYGGAATCTEKAKCALCGESYGELKPHSYSKEWSADEANHWHKCTECGAKADEAKHTDTDKDHKCDVCKKVLSVCADTDKDHKCDICGKKLSKHTGGAATCKDKAVCEICGKSYGKTNSDNHSELKHIDAKAATETAEGNIEYWYCEACGKYFADKDGTKKIKQADTVTPKLAEKPTIFPSTGDAGNLALWIALLLISSGAVTVTTAVSRKRKHSR